MPQLEDDDVITPALLRRFAAEAALVSGSDQFYALIRRTNGQLLSHHPGSPALIPEQSMWAADVLRALNRDLHHDGAWVVVFTDPAPLGKGDLAVTISAGHAEYARYALLWLDADGDVQFAMEWVRGESEQVTWVDKLLEGLLPVLQKAETSWQLWDTHMREVLDPAQGQTFKRAKGQRAQSVH